MIMENKNVDIKALNEKIQKESAFIDLLMLEVNKVIVGQKYMTCWSKAMIFGQKKWFGGQTRLLLGTC